VVRTHGAAATALGHHHRGSGSAHTAHGGAGQAGSGRTLHRGHGNTSSSGPGHAGAGDTDLDALQSVLLQFVKKWMLNVSAALKGERLPLRRSRSQQKSKIDSKIGL